MVDFDDVKMAKTKVASGKWVSKLAPVYVIYDELITIQTTRFLNSIL